ncbi:4'-phosphopantetheinyl transferase family protein [Vibrio hyugaensis]|uniref:4'-phosphopantetheinyl transferase family protein n=1 Tax=Vibrio hyugaensis TaxID=1534743 RepID=UPI000693DB0E|nr:4'-phosphopantetheinyl transferase superfamily protein [Vibrio hyugaensis]
MPRLTDLLIKSDPVFKYRLSDCWIKRHLIAPEVVGISICLKKLDNALLDRNLIHVLPSYFNNLTHKRKLTLLGGRLCAESLLLDSECSGDTISYLEGKPPIWPRGIKGSITHTDDVAHCIVTNSNSIKSLGVDIEYVNPVNTQKIITYCLTQTEIDKWLNDQPWTIDAIATLIFSAKESGFKALYPSILRFIDFKEFQTSMICFETNSLVLSPVHRNQDFSQSIKIKFSIEHKAPHTLGSLITTSALLQ